MKNKYEFKGWDWTELIPVMGLEEEYKKLEDVDPRKHHKAEEEFGELMAGNMRSYPYHHTDEETALFVQHLRTFLQVVIDEDEKVSLGAYKSFYEGILKTEDDHAFLSVYSHNLTCMWT